MTFSPNCMTFGDARRLRGKVPETSRRVLREHYKALAAFLSYLGKSAQSFFARLIEALASMCRVGKQATDYDSRYDDNVYPFPSSIIYEPELTPLQRLAAKAREQQETTPMLVKMPAAQDCLQHDAPALIMPTPTMSDVPAPRKWLSISTTPGLSNVIKVSELVDTKTARVAHPEWFPGPSSRWNKVHA